MAKNQDFNKKDEDENLPGYPHYPDNEDLENNAERVDINMENISRAVDSNTTITENAIPDRPVQSTSSTTAVIPPDPEGEIELVPGNEADVTEEDLMALVEIGLSPDEGDDQILMQHRVRASDRQIDVPGAELDDASENIGSEDEENNYYSLGGDENDNLEDDSQSPGL